MCACILFERETELVCVFCERKRERERERECAFCESKRDVEIAFV